MNEHLLRAVDQGRRFFSNGTVVAVVGDVILPVIVAANVVMFAAIAVLSVVVDGPQWYQFAFVVVFGIVVLLYRSMRRMKANADRD